MDISVSRLNNRMALQVPGELPLGLVFIVGRVENLSVPDEDSVRFELVDAGYRLRCHLPAAVAEETLLKEKDRVRASGHLAFDSHSAQYQLLARDIEVLAAHPPGEEGAQKAATAVQQSTNAASLVPTELPPWVRKLAPPEVKAELGLDPAAEEGFTTEETDVGERLQATGSRARELPPEMVAFLSNAIDSDEEIELTPEMIAEYLPQAPPRTGAVQEGEETATVAGNVREEGQSRPVEDVTGTDAGEAREEEQGVEQVIEQETDGGGPDVEAVSVGHSEDGTVHAPPDLADATVAAEEPAEHRPAVLSPPEGAPRRERRPQPQAQPRQGRMGPARRYVEYALIAFLVLLIMVALFLIFLLLLT